MREKVLSALQNGATVVTATRRLARTLLKEYGEMRLAGGSKAWESPHILNWSGWIDELWQEFLYSGEKAKTLLSDWQERVLWERVILDAPDSGELLQVHTTAAAAQEAWRLVNEWRLDLRNVEQCGSEDARAFVRWVGRFGEICEQKGWLEPVRKPDSLREAAGRLRLPSVLLMAGFDELTPQQKDFLEACSASGCRVTEVKPVSEIAPSAMVRVPFPDPAEEIEAAARWTRSLLEDGVSGGIGVVIADLASRRNQVERIFRAILEPCAHLPGQGSSSGLINVSAGKALSSYPMIQVAFSILNLLKDNNDWAQISYLVRSSYLCGSESERTGRALLDARMREEAGDRVSISRLRDLCRTAPNCPSLEGALGAWSQVCPISSTVRTAGEWGRTFSAMLEAFGWPGERSLSSDDFQTLKAWNEVLSRFASTNLTGGPITIGEARSLLSRIAGQVSFQPETEQASVQILGVLEASGISFDHLWIAGLHDEAWPGPASPNPFLPPALQREKGIPRCSPERELEFASLVTRRLLQSSPNLVVSYPVRAEDRDLGPSPLIASLPISQSTDLKLWDGSLVSEIIQQSRSVEEIVDETGPPLEEGASQRGGTRVLQYQSGCPFRAFVELRLGAEPLESPAPGLDPRQRGTLVHAALEEIWTTLKTHAALCSHGNLPELIRVSVDDAIARLEETGTLLPPAFAQLERQRIQQLLTEWLELEKLRQPFEVVQPEGERFAEVGGIRCRLKIDRVDRLADGREIIIDYKTGDTNHRSWDSERPDEPQLPLYSTVHDNPLAGVLFARLKTGDLRFLGYVDKDLEMRNCDTVDLGAQIQQWRGTLAKLGMNFRAGRAEVDPKDPNKQCRYCRLACLCRIAEMHGSAGEEEVV